MSSAARSSLFRILTILSSGFGAASLSLWAIMLNRLNEDNPFAHGAMIAVVAGLATLAGAGCAHAYFAGSDAAKKAYEDERAVDATTGLLSRQGLDRALEKIRAALDTRHKRLMRWMLVSIEVDAFRDINDTYGTDAGDSILMLLGNRLRNLAGELGPVARVSGSEFAFAIEMTGNDRELHAVMTAVIDEMTRPVPCGDVVVPVFCTAGLTELTGTQPIAILLRRAALARNTARATGLGSWAIYHPEMSQTDRYRKWIESELPVAIRSQAFTLAYQPQVAASTGAIVGYEALIRWEHPQHGFIPPSVFIPVAEKCGMIGQIGAWVLKQACEDARHVDPDVKIAVNVSPKQIEDPGFVPLLSRTLRNSGIKPGQIELEITENVLILDHPAMRTKFQEIRALGCSIAIDDFGTGYSNLGYLAELQFCKLKLDRSMVARLGDRENGEALVATVVNLGHALNALVLAEGVETEEQVRLLQAAGCNLMQGHYFGEAGPIERHEPVAA